jgi:hypothetical protein
MALVKQLNELLPESEVKVMEHEMDKYANNVYLSYKIEVYWKPHITMMICMSMQQKDNCEICKNKLPELFLSSDDYDFISEFDFQALSEFITAHTGEWTSITNII